MKHTKTAAAKTLLLSLNNPHNHKIPVFMRVTSKFA